MLLTLSLLSYRYIGKSRKGKKLRRLNKLKLRSKFWQEVYEKQLEAGTCLIAVVFCMFHPCKAWWHKSHHIL